MKRKIHLQQLHRPKKTTRKFLNYPYGFLIRVELNPGPEAGQALPFCIAWRGACGAICEKDFTYN
jgi:hypothetical protein